MSALVIDGKAAAAELREEVAREVALVSTTIHKRSAARAAA
jgi:hypothetical protein